MSFCSQFITVVHKENIIGKGLSAYLQSTHSRCSSTSIVEFALYARQNVLKAVRINCVSNYSRNVFFFLLFSVLIGWQISIWKCCKPLFSLLYNCQLLYFWWMAFEYCSRDLPTAFFPDIAPSRMFTTNTLCLIICPNQEWRVFFLKIFNSILSSFALWKTSSFVILSVHYYCTLTC
jgi:hypothetical protein